MITDCDETAFNRVAEGKGCFWPFSDLNGQGQVVPQCDFQFFKGTLALCIPPDSNCVSSTEMNSEQLVSERRARKGRHSGFMLSRVTSGSCAKDVSHILFMPQKELEFLGVEEC